MVNGEWGRVRTGPPPSTPFTIYHGCFTAWAAVWSPSPLRGGDRGGGPRASIWSGFRRTLARVIGSIRSHAGEFSRMSAGSSARARTAGGGGGFAPRAPTPTPVPSPQGGGGTD